VYFPPVWHCEGSLQGTDQECGADRHLVCAVQFVDSAQAVDESAGMSAPEMRQKGPIGAQKAQQNPEGGDQLTHWVTETTTTAEMSALPHWFLVVQTFLKSKHNCRALNLSMLIVIVVAMTSALASCGGRAMSLLNRFHIRSWSFPIRLHFPRVLMFSQVGTS